MPIKELERHLLGLLELVEEQIVIGYERNIFSHKKMDPMEVIVMIMTNLIVNLFGSSQVGTTSIKDRLMLLESLIDDIKSKSMHLWKTIETSTADADHTH
jgi:hypothetical protein